MLLPKYHPKKAYWPSDPLDAQIAILRRYDWGREIQWGLTPKQIDFLSWPRSREIVAWFAMVFEASFVQKASDRVYASSLSRALENLSKSRNGKLVNYRGNQPVEQYCRRSRHSSAILDMLWRIQGCPKDVILIPAELYMIQEEGSPVPSSCDWNQSGFGSYEMTTVFLTHPGYATDVAPWFVASGDHYSFDEEDDSEDSPIYGLDSAGNLVFPAYRIRNENKGYCLPFMKLPAE